MSPPSESTGALLRRERERQGLTVQKVAEGLHLDKAVVEALEDDSYERSVPSVYAKGHLRKYTQLLGLAIEDGRPALTTQASAEPLTAPTRSGTRVMRIAPRVKKLPWTRISVGMSILLVLLLFWWSPWKHRVTIQASTPLVTLPTEIPSTSVEAAPSTAQSTEPAAATAVPAASSAATPAGAVPTDAAADAAATGRVRLHLTFSTNSWVDVRDASGKRVFMGHGYANTTKNLAGKAPFRVYIGYVSGVRVEVNGREMTIDPSLVKGDIARFTVGADGLLHPST
jgi:cytoskeleton protein RodZ